MPEIAEVATYAEQLNKEYGNHQLLNVEVIGGRFLKEYDNFKLDLKDRLYYKLSLLTFPFTNVSMTSKGKFLYWTMQDHNKDQLNFHISLAMAGSFGKKQKHSAIRFEFDNGEVFFNDPRHFGTFDVSYGKDELNKKLIHLGWDPLKNQTVPTDIVARFRKHNHKKIGEFLMEQGPVLCGVGNWIRAELLHKCGISPFRLIKDLSDQEIEIICQNTVDIVKEAFLAGGASIKTYSDLYGIAGTFYQQFKVYGKKTDPNGNKVLTAKDKNGRTIHYVPEIQL